MSQADRPTSRNNPGRSFQNPRPSHNPGPPNNSNHRTHFPTGPGVQALGPKSISRIPRAKCPLDRSRKALNGWIIRDFSRKQKRESDVGTFTLKMNSIP